MRKFVPVAAAFASAAAAALPMMPADAAVTYVLTIRKAGGPAVRSGAVLRAHLVDGTKAVFSMPTGPEKLKCKVSRVAATVRRNPATTGTAAESLTAVMAARCALSPSIIPLTVKSVTAGNLPYKVTVSVSNLKGFPVTVRETSTTRPVAVTVKLAAGTRTIRCTYHAARLRGAASKTGSAIRFSKQKLTKAAGSSSMCIGPAFFSATYGPVRDTSVTNSPRVFVNPGALPPPPGQER